MNTEKWTRIFGVLGFLVPVITALFSVGVGMYTGSDVGSVKQFIAGYLIGYVVVFWLGMFVGGFYLLKGLYQSKLELESKKSDD